MNDVGAVIDFVRIVGTQLSVMQIEYLIGENAAYNPQFTASKAWVSKPAPIVYGAKGGDQEWTIRCVGEFAPE